MFEKQPDAEEDVHLMPEEIKDKRLLIVDDSNTNLKILGEYLSKWGFSFDQAQSAEVALKLLNAVSKVGSPYDLVITDMQMPVMDGYIATQTIRAPESRVLNHDINIIALTAHAMKGDKDKCIAAGMNDYLPKPINPIQLHNIVEKYLCM